jgi:hypothetical protein
MSNICLTHAQKESFDFIQKYYKQNGCLPTMTEVANDANCTVPGIAYRVAAAFLKGAFGHNAQNERHIPTEPMAQVTIPAVKHEDLFESFYDHKRVKSEVYWHLCNWDYNAREIFEGRKNGPRGGPLTYLLKRADNNARKDAASYAVGLIDELIAEGKIKRSGDNADVELKERYYNKVWFSYEFKTEEEYEAATAKRQAEIAAEQEAERVERERVEAEQAAKQNEKNAVLANAFVSLLSNPDISKLISEMTGVTV